jgi:hypothetical protein
MGLVQPLEAAALYQRCDPMQFAFETTADLEDLTGVIGQDRAVEAVRFGIGISRQAIISSPWGRKGQANIQSVRRYLERQAAGQPPPFDWCYVATSSKPTNHAPAAAGRRWGSSAATWSVS